MYNELVNRGYDVYIGKTSKGEVDFLASKNDGVKYIQIIDKGNGLYEVVQIYDDGVTG